MRAADYSLADLAAITDGARQKDEALYDLAYWHAYHVGAFCRAAYHAKQYPKFERVWQKWEEGKRKARHEPEKPGHESWRSLESWFRGVAAASQQQAAKKKKGK